MRTAAFGLIILVAVSLLGTSLFYGAKQQRDQEQMFSGAPVSVPITDVTVPAPEKAELVAAPVIEPKEDYVLVLRDEGDGMVLCDRQTGTEYIIVSGYSGNSGYAIIKREGAFCAKRPVR